jgi:hypothetical protein
MWCIIEKFSSHHIARILSLVLEERDELNKLMQKFASFKEHFDRGLHVQSSHTVADLQVQVESLVNKAGKRVIIQFMLFQVLKNS